MSGEGWNMDDDDQVGYGSPPQSTRWQKGQSGNPKGRPRTRSDLIQDAAKILTQPVEARTQDGKRVTLEAIEAGYLSLCKKGLNGHKTSLFEAIRIMLDVGPALEAEKKSEESKREAVRAEFERMGVKIQR
jgi:hypothetical protein